MSCRALFAPSITSSNRLGTFFRQSSTVTRATGFSPFTGTWSKTLASGLLPFS